MKFCSNCGSELKEGADICLGCGKIINQSNKKKKSKVLNNDNGDSNLVIILNLLYKMFSSISVLFLFLSVGIPYVSLSIYMSNTYFYPHEVMLIFGLVSVGVSFIIYSINLVFKSNAESKKLVWTKVIMEVVNVSLLLVAAIVMSAIYL